MKLINNVLITIFAFALSTAALAYCINQMLLKADYVTAQLDKSGIYSDLATQLPKQLAGDQSQPALQNALKTTITPEFLKSNIDAYIQQLQSAYAKGLSLPTLDLSSAVTAAQNLGANLTPEEARSLADKLTIKPAATSNGTQNSKSTTWYRRIASSQWQLALAALVAGVLVVLTAPHHHLKSLSKGFIHAAIWLLGYFVLFHFIPNISAHQLKSLSGANPLSGSVNNLIALAAAGVAKQLLYVAAGFGIIGAGLWLASHFVPHLGHNKDKDRTPLPTLFHKE